MKKGRMKYRIKARGGKASVLGRRGRAKSPNPLRGAKGAGSTGDRASGGQRRVRKFARRGSRVFGADGFSVKARFPPPGTVGGDFQGFPSCH